MTTGLGEAEVSVFEELLLQPTSANVTTANVAI